MALDANIILSADKFQAPDLMGSAMKATQVGNAQLAYDQNRINAEDNAKMSTVLRNLDPNDPMYGNKAAEALQQAGVSPAKALEFKKDVLGVASSQAEIDLKKIRVEDALKKQLENATDVQLKQIAQANGIIGNTLGDVISTYDSIVEKGGDGSKSTASAAAQAMFRNHAQALLDDPTTPEQLKKLIQAKMAQPFNIEEARALHSQSSNQQALLEAEKARRDGRLTDARIAQTEANTDLIEKKTEVMNNDPSNPVNQSPAVKETMAELMKLMGPTAARMTKTSRDQTVANIVELQKKYPDLKPADIADMVVNGASDTKVRAATEKEFATGMASRNVQSLNVAIQHFSQLSDLVKGLNNDPVQFTNKVKNWAKTQLGDDSVTNFDTAKEVVSKEFVKAIIATGGGVGEREEMAKIFDSAKSPQQLDGAIKQAQGLLAGQMVGLEKRYVSSMDPDGKESDRWTKRFRGKLAPETIKAIGSGGHAGGAGGHGDGKQFSASDFEQYKRK